MSVYSVRFFAGTLPIADANLYTVPTNQTVVLRDIEMYNYSGAQQSFAISALVAGSTAHILQIVTPAAVQSTQWQGRAVLESGEVLQAHCTSASNFCYISGYLLGP